MNKLETKVNQMLFIFKQIQNGQVFCKANKEKQDKNLNKIRDEK